MLANWKQVVAVLLLGWTKRQYHVHGQGDYLAIGDITQTWAATTRPVGPGNGAFTAPDGSTVVVVSSDCTITAYDPRTGTPTWGQPYSPATTSRCSGGPFFSYEGNTKYIAVSVYNPTAAT